MLLLLLLLLEQNAQYFLDLTTVFNFETLVITQKKHCSQSALVNSQMHGPEVKKSLYLHFVGDLLDHARHCLRAAQWGIR